MSLTCQEETSGWGADDIALQIRADGDLIADIPNSVIGDFEDDAVRHVGDKIAAPITPYVESIEVTVIEEDDIDDNDVGVGIVPLVTRPRAHRASPSCTLASTAASRQPRDRRRRRQVRLLLRHHTMASLGLRGNARQKPRPRDLAPARHRIRFNQLPTGAVARGSGDPRETTEAADRHDHPPDRRVTTHSSELV